jgi:hypothetical protein
MDEFWNRALAVGGKSAKDHFLGKKKQYDLEEVNQRKREPIFFEEGRSPGQRSGTGQKQYLKPPEKT